MKIKLRLYQSLRFSWGSRRMTPATKMHELPVFPILALFGNILIGRDFYVHVVDGVESQRGEVTRAR